MRKIKWFALIILVVGGVVFFGFLPFWVDKSRNLVTSGGLTKSDLFYSLPFIADLHCDALLWDRDLQELHKHGHVDLPRLQQAGVDLQVFSIVTKTPRGMNIDHNDDQTDNITPLTIAQAKPFKTWFSLHERAINQCLNLHDLAKNSKNALLVIQNKKQWHKFMQLKKTQPNLVGGMLGIEGAHCLEGDLSKLDTLAKLGVIYIGLSHFFDNEWCGSAHGIKQGGLTDIGKGLVKKMEELAITIDLAHASKKTIDEVLAIATRPILVSHTGVYGVCPNARNLSDNHLKKIAQNGGIIGVGLWETAVCGTDARATAKSIRYIVDKIGINYVALGSDFDGAVKTHFDVTGLNLLVPALQEEGFSEQEIIQIMGGNIQRFFEENLPN